MCGITGFIGFNNLNATNVYGSAKQMGEAILHRGPDNIGIWSDNENQVALIHSRLSILDLSSAGHQPMESASGRYVIIFNGEIYNHNNLRRKLENLQSSTAVGKEWHGHSDTETFLACIEAWGLEVSLNHTVGMFAIALWDKQDKTLSLARDRLGEKPLYYGCQRGVFMFGSELKALKAHPAFEAKIDRNSLTLHLRHNYIPTPYSIYQGIKKLPPGTILKLHVRIGLFAISDLPEPIQYWSLENVINGGRDFPFKGGDSDAVDILDRLLKDSVKQQMLADVPLGAFLSGGIDSSTIVSLMQAQSVYPVKTFSIGFNEEGYNEAVHAKAVAKHLGTEHTELYVTSQQAMDVIPRLTSLYDEPFSDSSQIPTFLVSEMTRQHVTVSLSGDAGDELFGGYSRYNYSEKLWRMVGALSLSGRIGLAKAIQKIPTEVWDLFSSPFKPFIPLRMRNIGDKAHKLAAILDSFNQLDFYRNFISHWSSEEDVVIGGSELNYYFNQEHKIMRDIGYIDLMMMVDTLTYLPDDILCKVDRAAMGVSLETRVPFLDHRVVEFSWRLPLSMKIRNGQGKWILRQVLKKYIPKEMIDRPKMGFSIPIDAWLRGPLRDWAESLLNESRLRNEGFFNPAPIRQKWLEHLSGRRNWQYHLWNVLMFQAWLEAN